MCLHLFGFLGRKKGNALCSNCGYLSGNRPNKSDFRQHSTGCVFAIYVVPKKRILFFEPQTVKRLPISGPAFKHPVHCVKKDYYYLDFAACRTRCFKQISVSSGGFWYFCRNTAQPAGTHSRELAKIAN